jgi:hypothetical protein
MKTLVARVLIVVLSAGVTAVWEPQQPRRAEIDGKTSGLIRALAAPADLAGSSLPRPETDLEKALSDVGVTVSRGIELPPIELFVQYAPGAGRDGGAVIDPRGDVIPSLVANDSVRAVEVLRPPVFQPEEVRPFNRDARRTHRVPEFIAKFPGMEGGGRLAAVIDAGAVLATHREFQVAGPPASRRVTVSTTRPADQHSTHVAGTIVATGIDQRARGMAPAGSVVSLDFVRDLQTYAGLTGTIHVTNHSYGPYAGWDYDSRSGWRWWGDRSLSEDEDATFGKYTARESTFDELLIAPHRAGWLAFIAAGNDRNDGPARQPVSHYAITVVGNQIQWQLSQQVRRADGDDRGGLDTVTGLCVAKNVVCVGAIHDAQAGQPFETTDFSAWGPADDGRIKPDLVANGQNLLSTSNAADDAYLEMPGTSMASPAAAGIGLIVGQLFERSRGRAPLATDLKAVLIHSAIDAGRPGPDAAFGWGVIDALRAGDVVSQPERHSIETVEVGMDRPVLLNFESNGDPTIRVTVVWHDPAAPANRGGVDDGTPVLQNDLDLQLKAPGGAPHFPYRLDRANPTQPARRDGPNRVDNVEVVDAPAAAGPWQVQITARSMSRGPQKATVVTSGLRRR